MKRFKHWLGGRAAVTPFVVLTALLILVVPLSARGTAGKAYTQPYCSGSLYIISTTGSLNDLIQYA